MLRNLASHLSKVVLMSFGLVEKKVPMEEPGEKFYEVVG